MNKFTIEGQRLTMLDTIGICSRKSPIPIHLVPSSSVKSLRPGQGEERIIPNRAHLGLKFTLKVKVCGKELSSCGRDGQTEERGVVYWCHGEAECVLAAGAGTGTGVGA